MIPILIVTADPNDVALFNAALARHFALSFAASAETALAVLSEAHPPLAIVSAGAHPGEAPDVCRALHAAQGERPLRVLLIGPGLSALAHADLATLGADAVLASPFEAGSLKQALRPLLASLAQQQSRPAPAQAALAAPDPAPSYPAPTAAQLASLGLSARAQAALSPMDLARLVWACRHLDDRSYYALLGIEPSAASSSLRRRYLSWAKFCHPDRYALLDEPALRAAVTDVFKRMVEAYQVLGDAEKRARYDAQLAKGGPVRLDLSERPEEANVAEERSLPPQAKKFYALAQSAQAAGDLKTARMNLTLALSVVRDHPLLTRKLAELKSLGG